MIGVKPGVGLAGFLVVESVEEFIEGLLSADLAFGLGVVSLAAECGCEFDGGDEAGAGFADCFVVAVEFDGSDAVAVAEQALVHFGSEFAHLVAFVVGGKLAGLVVEGFDLFGDSEVLVCNGAVSDTCVDHHHGEGLVTEEGGDRFEAHASVDGLGGEGVAQLVGGGRDRSRRLSRRVGRPDRLVVGEPVDPGAGEDLDGEPVEWVGKVPCSSHEPGG